MRWPDASSPAVGYLNSQHAHAWDFVDAPLAYQAFFGGQYKNDGLQFKWLAPTDLSSSSASRSGAAHAFPGTRSQQERRESASLVRACRRRHRRQRQLARRRVVPADQRSRPRPTTMWIAPASPVTNASAARRGCGSPTRSSNGRPAAMRAQTNLKLQGEYFRRTRDGTLTYDTRGASTRRSTGDYRASQSGWYVQGVYQFMPRWRVGAALRPARLRHAARIDEVDERRADRGRLLAAAFRTTRRAPRDGRLLAVGVQPLPPAVRAGQARPGATDNQIFLQYIMSLGAHGAHVLTEAAMTSLDHALLPPCVAARRRARRSAALNVSRLRARMGRARQELGGDNVERLQSRRRRCRTRIGSRRGRA